MSFVSLRLSGFRNLASQNLSFLSSSKQESARDVAGIVGIYGNNGSGKSSLVEALYLCSHAKSFRANELNKLIQFGEERFTVFSQLTYEGKKGCSDHAQEVGHSVGLGKERRGRLEINLNRKAVKRTSELAALCPILFVEPESLNLINGSPKVRRQFLDFGLFHVKQGFSEVYRNWRLVNQHRSALLRRYKGRGGGDCPEFELWDKKYCALTLSIIQSRDKLIDNYNRLLKSLCEKPIAELNGLLEGFSELDIQLRQTNRISPNMGREELTDSLRGLLDQEFRYGYSLYGPQTSKVEIFSGDQLAKDKLSRGQQKKVIILLKLLQLQEIKGTTNKSCVAVIDDFGSELDLKAQDQLLGYLAREVDQLILTALDDGFTKLDAFKKAQETGIPVKVFHVKQGLFVEQKLSPEK